MQQRRRNPSRLARAGQNGQLVPEGQILKGEISAGLEDRAERGCEGRTDLEHPADFGEGQD